MQGRRGGRDPFSDFGAPFPGFGGFGGSRSLLSGFFGGRDPFDDPFFTRPFGGMFESGLFGPGGSPFVDMHPSGYIEHRAQGPTGSKGPIIEELDSDDGKEEADEEKDTKTNLKKHGRPSKEPYVEDPNDEVQERKSKHLQSRNDYKQFHGSGQWPQAHSFSFQTSTVTSGGANGAYYTSSKTKRSGSDGVIFEESKEADTSTGKATHKISRGLHNKGHTLTRKLNSDGKVNTMQTLHNLHEDELTSFEQAWMGNAGQILPGWSGNFIGHNTGASSSGLVASGGWALPSTEHFQQSQRTVPDGRGRSGSSHLQHSGRAKRSSDGRDQSRSFQGRTGN